MSLGFCLQRYYFLERKAGLKKIMNHPLEKRTCSGQPIKCPGMCNPRNQHKIKNTLNRPQPSLERKLILDKSPISSQNNQKQKTSRCFFRYLVVVTMYIGIHALIGILAIDHPYYPNFLATQFCGFLALLLWGVSS